VAPSHHCQWLLRADTPSLRLPAENRSGSVALQSRSQAYRRGSRQRRQPIRRRLDPEVPGENGSAPPDRDSPRTAPCLLSAIVDIGREPVYARAHSGISGLTLILGTVRHRRRYGRRMNRVLNTETNAETRPRPVV
jgi:hypothetical protein